MVMTLLLAIMMKIVVMPINDDDDQRLDNLLQRIDEIGERETVWNPETLAMAARF